MTKLLAGGVFILILIVLTHASPSSYFKVLIREIDNPSGTLLDGTPCSPFGFVGYGCNTYLSGGVAVGSELSPTADKIALNSHGETKISNLNLILADPKDNEVTEFTGFNVSLKLTTVDGSVIDQYDFRVDTTDSQGVYVYTSKRQGTLATTISIAWATNIPEASLTTSTPVYTGSTPTPGPTTTAPKLPSDCDEVKNKTSGIQTIYPDGLNPVDVYCEQTTNGAYTVIQSRGTSTNITFDIPYSNYSDWFGEPGIGKNFWMGLDNMNSLSNNGKVYSLQIDICCGTQLRGKQIYHGFKVDTKANLYKLTATADLPGIGLDYSSTFKDIGAPFSTEATYSKPKSKGWWYGSCGNNLNGFLYPSDNANCTVE
ncbi:hypothetical protein CAEBREN_31816 [Caenorhabditis brenneri]|uniref:Fibrinogen C-terminal domain-containing protein n=1 Tax=Caenorhabditis brenneri TaxID=135651 RepID=G0PB16_CAEBE|nr:hypothetical protein CAEBREN_31816 [Caenorhabditis brenneri]